MSRTIGTKLLAMRKSLLAPLTALTAGATISVPEATALKIGLILSAGGVLVAWTVPTGVTVLIVASRSLSDVGVASRDPLLANDLASSAVSVTLLALCLARFGHSIVTRWAAPLLGFGGVAAIWLFIAMTNFGRDIALVGEALRLASIFAMFAFSYLSLAESASRWSVSLVVFASVIPAALTLVVGYLSGNSLLVGPDGRAVGTFSHANSAAAFMAVGVVAALYLALQSMTPRAWAMTAVIFGALILTQSFGGLLAAAMGSAILVTRISGLSRLRRLWIACFALCMSTGIAFVTGGVGRLDELGSTQSLGIASNGVTTNSVDWRFYNWSLLIRAWHEHPWLGYGLGATNKYVQPGHNLPHSVVLQLLVEYGTIGLASLMLCGFALMRSVAKYCRVRDSRVDAVIAILVVAATQSLASNLLGYTAAMYLIAATCGALMGSIEESMNGRTVGCGPITRTNDRAPSRS